MERDNDDGPFKTTGLPCRSPPSSSSLSMTGSEDRGAARAFVRRQRRGILVHLDPGTLAAIDDFIASQPQAVTRQEAIRKLIALGLPRVVEVNVSDQEHSWGGDAVMTQPKPNGLK